MLDHVETKGRKGEWYYGAQCPTCGSMAAHTHDPSRGTAEVKIDATLARTPMSLVCPKGHRFDVLAEDMIRFEWGAQ